MFQWLEADLFWSNVITQVIWNKFIEIKTSVGCMVWLWLRLFQHWPFVKYWWDVWGKGASNGPVRLALLTLHYFVTGRIHYRKANDLELCYLSVYLLVYIWFCSFLLQMNLMWYILSFDMRFAKPWVFRKWAESVASKCFFIIETAFIGPFQIVELIPTLHLVSNLWNILPMLDCLFISFLLSISVLHML